MEQQNSIIDIKIDLGATHILETEPTTKFRNVYSGRNAHFNFAHFHFIPKNTFELFF